MEPETDEHLYAIDVVVVQQPTAPGRSVPPLRCRVVTAWLSELVIEATTAPEVSQLAGALRDQRSSVGRALGRPVKES